MPNKEFLEDFSLFRKYKAELPETLDQYTSPPINMDCRDCGSIQTFSMSNSYSEGFRYLNVSAADKKLKLLYTCQSCKKFERQFHIYISQDLDYCYKFGQYPEWELKMDKNVERLLGKHAKSFRKGLVCESQSYGVGAFAYYRRITEEIIDELLESISELINIDEKERYLKALEQTKKTRVTQEKIELIKDLLPAILKPNGINPLGVLHSELSEGLHANSDEECLEKAHHIKEILTFLINQILHAKQSAKQFTDGMKSLLEKKSVK